MMDMTLGNLLVISNDFPDKLDKYIVNIFVKEQLKYIKNNFENIYVVSPIPIGLGYLRKRHYTDYDFDNVHVYFLRYINFPVFHFYYRNFWIYLEKRALINFLSNQNIKFDLIHAHYTWPSGAIATEIKKEFSVPVVITEHTSSMFSKAIDKKDNTFIRAWMKSDAIIRVRNDKFQFEKVGVNRNKIYYIPNGYDKKKFVKVDQKLLRGKLGLPLNTKIILSVGRLDKVKGYDYLIKSMKNLVDSKKDILCIIIGGGTIKDKLENQIEESKLENYVKLLGAKPYDEIPIWMNIADIFVMSSLNEGNPTVMFEALGMGLPFVGTKVGGIPDVMISEEYGLLCEPANPTSLAEKIQIALEKEWDQELIFRYAKQFTWDNIAKEILNVYELVLINVP